jgi:hypothetical protein
MPPLAPSRIKRVARAVSLLVAFAAGFAVISTGIRYVISVVGLSAYDDNVSKPREAARQRADFIFFGPSHIAMGIDPEIFDAELARYVTVHSFNMAMGGLSVPEVDFLLKRFFAIDNCCVKYVAFYPAFELTDIARKGVTFRSIDYFNLSNAFQYWSYLKEYNPIPGPHLDMFDYAMHIFVSTLQHYSNMGLGLRPFEITEYAVRHNQVTEKYTGGYFPTDRAVVGEGELKEWLAAVEELKNHSPHFSEQLVSDYMFSKVTDIIDTIERQGARAIVVRPPSTWRWQYDLSFVRKYKHECPTGPPLLDFGDPSEYPELYEGLNRYDVAHLNTRGATLWSRILAEQVGELIQSGRLAHPAYCARAKG